jgi:SSS family solute:Na+ symporter
MLDKRYDPKQVEAGKYSKWKESGYFTAGDKSKQKLDQVAISRVGILIAIILALIMAYSLPGSVVALGTSLFFEICAAAFLPVFLGALYWKGITRLGAIAGIVSGTLVSLFWLMFVFKKTAVGLGICKFILGVETILPQAPWPFIDVMLIAVPISAIFTIDSTRFLNTPYIGQAL